MSLQNSNDMYSQYNTCDDYLKSSRTNCNKYAPSRIRIDSAGTNLGELSDFGISKQQPHVPLTAREKDQAGVKWHERKRSIDVGHISHKNQRLILTTGESVSRPTKGKMSTHNTEREDSVMSNTVGYGPTQPMLKPQFLNIEVDKVN